MNKSVIDYIVLEDYSKDELSQRVLDLLNLRKGWEPQGGLAITNEPTATFIAQNEVVRSHESRTLYAQAMVKMS